MLDSIRGKSIVVWGTGKDAVKATACLSEQGYTVKKYVSGTFNANIPVFMDKEVVPVESCIAENDIFFVVALRDVYWEEAKRRLTDEKRTEFKDFALWKIFDPHRKMVMMHGNCHLDVIEEYLTSSAEFNVKYWIYPYRRVCELNDSNIDSYMSALGLADVWIYQHIRLDNSISKVISDEFTHPLLKENALKIAIPNYYGLGRIIFPQTKLYNPHNPWLSDGRDKNGLFPRIDTVVDSWVEKNNEGYSPEDVVAYCCSEEALPAEEILDNYRQMAEKIISRDTDCDVEAGPYILDNLSEEQMFYDLGHPTNAVLKRLAIGILKILGIEETDDICCSTKLCYHEDPVYPQVKKVLGLKWDRQYIRDTEMSKKIANQMDFKEYIKEYLFWCYSLGE